KLSLFMIATAAVVGLSLATPENQTVSANEAVVTQACADGTNCCGYNFYGYCGPISWLFYKTKHLLMGEQPTTTTSTATVTK
ncbi:TPA: SpoV family signaling peptide, partial [Streptococcus pyogenes]